MLGEMVLSQHQVSSPSNTSPRIGYPWVLDVGSNLCGLLFALMHHTQNSTMKQDLISVWTIDNGLDLPKKARANPFQEVWCKLWDCRPNSLRGSNIGLLSKYLAFYLLSVHCLTRISYSDKFLCV